MNLSISQVQNVLRTYQRQVREERVKAILGVGEETSQTSDRLNISREGRTLLEGTVPRESDPDNPLSGR